MDWIAFGLSLRLAGWTCAVLLPLGMLVCSRPQLRPMTVAALAQHVRPEAGPKI